MIFVCEGRSEQRENTIACGLDDVAIVAAHCLDHQFQGGIDDAARLLRIEVCHQFGRSLDIGEQRGHCLALTIELTVGLALG